MLCSTFLFCSGAGTRGHSFNVLLLALLCRTGPRGALTHRRRRCGIGSRQNPIVFDFGAQVSLRLDGPVSPGVSKQNLRRRAPLACVLPFLPPCSGESSPSSLPAWLAACGHGWLPGCSAGMPVWLLAWLPGLPGLPGCLPGRLPNVQKLVVLLWLLVDTCGCLSRNLLCFGGFSWTRVTIVEVINLINPRM